MNKKKASSTLYFIFFFIIFLAFCAFAVDGAIVFTNRAKLQGITEMTAMVAASEFNYDSDPSTISATDENNVKTVANTTFNTLKQDSLRTAIMDTPAISGNIVTITTSMVSQPFFLSFLGVSGINLKAHAEARSETISVMGGNYSGINWLTKSKPYRTDIIPQDSAILTPLGEGFKSASWQSGATEPNYGLLSSDSNPIQPLSLGPGGFVTIKLPAPIVDKDGYDLYIKEVGDAKEGYMVFAGLDNDPNNPYVDHTDTASAGLSWVNISCTGAAIDVSPASSALGTASTNRGPQTKIYGSANFDISKSCDGHNGIHMAKYIRIIDDNSEEAYVNNSHVWVYGESSSPTAGADIDSVKVLNHVRLQ